jgi:uncharacterized protein YegJ (DUF2314 family)
MNAPRAWLVVLLALATPATAAPPPGPTHRGWETPTAQLEVALVCTEGALRPKAVEASGAQFGSGRSLHLALVPRAELPQFKPEALGPTWAKLPAKAQAAIKAAQAFAVLTFTWQRADTAALPKAYALAGELAVACAGTLVDLPVLQAFSTADWLRDRVATAALPPVLTARHFAVKVSTLEDGTLLYDTLGLRRFGLSELVVPRVTRAQTTTAGLLLNAVVQRMVEGAEVAGSQLVLRLDELQEANFKKAVLARTFPNAKREVLVALTPSPGKGNLKPDSWLLAFPTFDCPTSDVCLGKALEQLFGSPGPVQGGDRDVQLAAARERAHTAIPTYAERFKKGLAPTTHLLAKGPFPYDKGNEWMWVEVQSWADGVLRGPLRSEPTEVRGLHEGNVVEIREADVYDMMLMQADGTFFGNETGRVLQPEAFLELGGGRARMR